MWRLRDGTTLIPAPRDNAPQARLLLLAEPTSYRVPAYRDAARTLGFDLVVGSEGGHALVPTGVEGINLPVDEPAAAIEKVLEEVGRRPFCAVLAADDSMVELASRIAAALDLPHNPLRAARATRRKDLGRESLRRAGLPVPGFAKLDLTPPFSISLDTFRFPCVVKPLAMSGSRGVIRADNAEELKHAVDRLRGILPMSTSESSTLLVEDYVPGEEVAVEGLLRDGVLDVLAIFDKPEPLEGPFFEETYYITPSRHPSSIQELLRDTIGRACRAYGLKVGPVHAEARLWDRKVWVLEVAARTIGGDCARLLEFGTGCSLEALVLSHAAGTSLAHSRRTEAAGVMMLPTSRSGTLRRVEGVLEARRVPLIEDVVIAVREGYELVPLPEGSSYLGFLFARGPTPDLVERALRDAYSKLKVITSPIWRIEPGVTSSNPVLESPQAGHHAPLLRTGTRACASR